MLFLVTLTNSQQLYYMTNLHWKKNILNDRWSVPQPYWYHGELDVDAYDIPAHVGRQLQVGTRMY